MAEQQKRYITAQGLAALQEELDRLISVERVAIAKEIEFARSYGDLSENAEYTEAKNKQSANETRIALLQDQISNLVVIEDKDITTDTISLGLTVRLLDIDHNREKTYDIVGSQEVDPLRGRISDESAIGHALIGLHVGDVAEVEAPAGVFHYKVLEITMTEKD
ncbi:MAG: transcription elongation factor GreA [Clostridia bacterium]|nr:transcription elongation factor GreA [Clostridia bacterium]